jgi:site-specific DNA recombinase
MRTDTAPSLAPNVRMILPLCTTDDNTIRKRQLRVAAYCRVSTDEEEQLTSYEAQKAYYTDKIMTTPEWTLADIFADEGITGTCDRKRPEFLKMIRQCKQGKIDIVLTKSISRFARNTVDCLKYIRLLKAQGIAVIFEKENINTLESDSEIVITMMGAFAQGESESISANVKWGQRQAMREGKVVFQYAKMYGYERGEDGKPKIIPDQAVVVRRIFDAYLAGSSVRAIKEMLESEHILTSLGAETWSVGVLQGMLRNEKYCGDALLQKTFTQDCLSKKVIKNTGQLPKYLVQNNHEGIISHNTFDRVQAEISRRAGTRAPSTKESVSGLAKYSSKYALTGILVCGECGTDYRRCVWSKNGNKRVVWRCISRLDYGTKYCKNSPTLEEGQIHHAVLAALNSAMSDRAKLIALVSGSVQSICVSNAELDSSEAVKVRICELEAVYTKLMDDVLENDSFAAHNGELKRLNDELAALREKYELLTEQESGISAAKIRREQIIDTLQAAPTEMTEWDDTVIRQLVSEVRVLGADRLEIILKSGARFEQSMGN